MALGKPNTVDTTLDVPKAVESQGTKAEAQVLLKYLLGIDVPDDLEAEKATITQQVVDRICSVVMTTRGTVAEDNLKTELDEKLDAALAATSKSALAGETERIRLLADVVYKSVPRDVMAAFVGKKMVPLGSMESGKSSLITRHAVVFPAPPVSTLGTKDVTIDLDHPFWRGKKLTDADALVKIFTAKGARVKDFGVRVIGEPDNLVLKKEEAEAIAGTAATPAQWDVVQMGNNFGDVERTDMGGTPPAPFTWKIDVDYIVMHQTDGNAPPALQNRLLGSMTCTQLADVLNFPAGGFSNWKKFAPDVAAKWPTPTVTSAPGGLAWSVYVAQQIFLHAGRNFADKLGGTQMQLHEIQGEVSDQHAIYQKLANGTQNYMGAALAAGMIMRDSSLRAVATGSDAELTKAINKLDAMKTLHKSLDELGKCDKPSLKKESGPMWKLNELRTEKTDLETDKAIVGTATVPGTTWKSDFASTSAANSDLNYPDPMKTSYDSGPDPKKDRNEDKKKINDNLKKVEAEIGKYEKYFTLLRKIRKSAAVAEYKGSYSTALETYLDLGVATAGEKEAAMTTDFKPDEVADAIRDDLKKDAANPLPELSNIEADLVTKNDEKKKVKDGAKTGDELQREVFAQHLKNTNRGLDDDNAKIGAGYLAGKTFLDQETDKGMDENIAEMFGDVEKEGFFGDHSYGIVSEIAQQCGIEWEYDNAWWQRQLGVGYNADAQDYERSFEWDRASYKQLCTAYFAMKQLLEGKGPVHLTSRMKNTAFMSKQMSAIAKILGTRYVAVLEKELGANLSNEEREKLKNKKGNYLSLVAKALSGDVPPQYAGKIEKMLNKVDSKYQWKRRWAGSAAKNLLWNWSTKPFFTHVPYAGYKATTWAARTGAGAVSGAVSGTASTIWQNKGTIAMWSAAFVLTGGAGPLLYEFGKKIAEGGGGGHGGGAPHETSHT